MEVCLLLGVLTSHHNLRSEFTHCMILFSATSYICMGVSLCRQLHLPSWSSWRLCYQHTLPRRRGLRCSRSLQAQLRYLWQPASMTVCSSGMRTQRMIRLGAARPSLTSTPVLSALHLATSRAPCGIGRPFGAEHICSPINNVLTVLERIDNSGELVIVLGTVKSKSRGMS